MSGLQTLPVLPMLESIPDPLRRPVYVSDVGGPAGRGMVASRDLEPGEVLVSVPFDRVFKSGDADDDRREGAEGPPEGAGMMHWAAGMALRLLRAKRDCRSGGQAAAASQHWCAWIDSLPGPEGLMTPLGFSEAEVEALGDPGVVGEVLGMQECIRACYDQVSSPCSSSSPSSGPEVPSWDEFLWAVQVNRIVLFGFHPTFSTKLLTCHPKFPPSFILPTSRDLLGAPADLHLEMLL